MTRWILLNPSSGGGTAVAKWKRLESFFPSDKYRCVTIGEKPIADMPIKEGDVILSAGGDGSFHFLINQCAEAFGLERLKAFRFGHIGLGSNNSFLKPFPKDKAIAGFPLRAAETSADFDLGEVTWKSQGRESKRYFVANASFGFLAQANVVFNRDPLVRKLKPLGPFVPDVTTFVKTLSAYRPVSYEVDFDGLDSRADDTNLHVMKRPSYAGDFYFDPPIEPGSGVFQIHWLGPCPRSEIARRFADVAVFGKMERGRTGGGLSAFVEIRAENDSPLEVDGEILWGRSFRLRCLPRALKILDEGGPR